MSNDLTGLDTDKLDYLARDSHAIGIGITFDPLRVFQNVKVFKYPN